MLVVRPWPALRRCGTLIQLFDRVRLLVVVLARVPPGGWHGWRWPARELIGGTAGEALTGFRGASGKEVGRLCGAPRGAPLAARQPGGWRRPLPGRIASRPAVLGPPPIVVLVVSLIAVVVTAVWMGAAARRWIGVTNLVPAA
jgi:hypothetical protein